MINIMRVLFAALIIFGSFGLLQAQAANNCTYPAHPPVDYVLPQNCMKACLEHGHHPLAYCRKTVGACETCWREFKACTHTRQSCGECSEKYARCMGPLHY